jgi:glycosyl transferase family 25
MSLNLFDKVFYINCNHRTDRKESIESIFDKLGCVNYERIEAVYLPDNGALGCAKSHLLALNESIKLNLNNVLILEDDFILNVSPKAFNKKVKKFFETSIDWDVLMLSTNLVKHKKTNFDFLNKVIEAQTTSGYAVNKNYMEKIINNFKEAEILLDGAERINGWYKDAIDQHWKTLQNDNWLSFCPTLGKQSDGWSDIENREVSYGC